MCVSTVYHCPPKGGSPKGVLRIEGFYLFLFVLTVLRTALVSAVGDIQHPVGLSDAPWAVEQSIGAGAISKALCGASEGLHLAGCQVHCADFVSPQWVIERFTKIAVRSALVLRNEERLAVI